MPEITIHLEVPDPSSAVVLADVDVEPVVSVGIEETQSPLPLVVIVH